MLRVKLRHLETWNAIRRQHASLYNRFLAGGEIATPVKMGYAESVWHLYVIRVADRDALKARLAIRGIATGIHYPMPIHLQPAYQDLGYVSGDFPITECYAEQILSLPMYAELTPSLIAYVAETIKDVVSDYSVELLVAQPIGK